MSRPFALDATLADEPTTGIALYGHELGRALEALGHSVERWGAARSHDLPRGRSSRTGWTLTQLPRLLTERQPRLFHALANFNLPLTRVPGVPFVLTVHDLVPLLLPDTVSTAFRWQFRAWLARALVVADQVICVSDVTRASLLEHFTVDPARVHVIHHGVDHVARLAAPDDVSVRWLDALGLPERSVLYAGSLDARKNVTQLLDAQALAFERGRPFTVVLAGQRWFGSSPVEQRILALKERGLDVRATGYLHASVFYELMRRARCFVFPSRYEGFGLPPLEAMSLGVPTIISDAGSLPEVCGTAALQVPLDDAGALAETIDAVLDSTARQADLRRAALDWSRRFRWENTARQTLAVYHRT